MWIPNFWQLKVEWEFRVDNEFPMQLFSAHQSPGASFNNDLPSSKLCNECRSVREEIFRADFQFTYDTAELRFRVMEKRCDLCDLLWKTCNRYGGDGGQSVHFHRVGSMLQMNDGTFPILSICRSPGR